MSNAPIGVFDSGVGGLTVVKELISTLPSENIVYFGDTARVPYGTKSAETILRYSIENAIFLLHQKVKCIVIACNTASAFALAHLQHLFKVPVVGVIAPGAHTALSVSKTKRIGIIGTTATIQSDVYCKELKRQNPDVEVFSSACPLFVPLIEEGLYSHDATKLLISEYLEPLLEHSIDTLLLGCTHYPLLKEQIQDVIGPQIHLVDSAKACAHEVKEILARENLLVVDGEMNVNKFFVSDDPKKFETMAVRFFGQPISHIERIPH